MEINPENMSTIQQRGIGESNVYGLRMNNRV